MKKKQMPEKDEPVWTVVESCEKRSKNEFNDVISFTASLMAEGRCHHVLRGAFARQTMQKYADELNAKNTPVPPPSTRTRADGWNQPKDSSKVGNLISPEIFNHVVK